MSPAPAGYYAGWPAPPGGFAPPAREEGSLRFGEIAVALRRGWWIIASVCAIVTATVVGYTMLQPKEFEAQAMVFIDTERAASADAAAAVAISGAGGGLPMDRRGIESELARLQHAEELRRRVAERIEEAGRVVRRADAFPLLAPDADGTHPARNEVARRLGETMRFEMLRDQDMISIKAVSVAPEEAARVANYYAEEYQALARESSRARVVAAREFLEEQVGRLGGDLAGIDGRVASFSAQRRLPERGPAGERLVEEHSSYRERRDAAAMELARQRFGLEVVRDELARLDPEGAATRSSDVASLESEIGAFERQITDLRLRAEQYYAVDPSLRGAESRVPELAEMTRSLSHYESQKQALVDRLGRAMAGRRMGDGGDYAAALQAQRLDREATVRGLETEIGLLDGRLGATSSILGGVPQAAVHLEQLERRRGIVATWYATFLQDLQRVMVAEQAELGYVELVSPAYVPTAPARPNLPQNTILGVLLGLGFGVSLALAKHAAQREIRRPDDLAEQGYRVLGVIPTMNKEIRESFGRRTAVEVEGRPISTRLLTMLTPWSPVAENFRLIRTNLLHGLDGLEEVFGTGDGQAVPTGRTVLVTSPESGAGKTVTASNLAVALATGGRRTLLVDADLRRPSAHRMFGVDGSRGLADVLQETAPWPERDPEIEEFAPLQTDIENLYFLPAGRPARPPSELVGSKRLEGLFDRARPVFDVIVVDSPPVLVAADAVLLARRADAVVMIVSAEHTDRRAIEEARRALEAVGHPVTGLIVNRFDERSSYGNSYGYTYDSKYGDGQEAAAA